MGKRELQWHMESCDRVGKGAWGRLLKQQGLEGCAGGGVWDRLLRGRAGGAVREGTWLEPQQ